MPAKKPVHKLPVVAEETNIVEPVQEMVAEGDGVEKNGIKMEIGQKTYELDGTPITVSVNVLPNQNGSVVVDEVILDGVPEGMSDEEILSNLGILVNPATGKPVDLPTVDLKDAKPEPILDAPHPAFDGRGLADIVFGPDLSLKETNPIDVKVDFSEVNLEDMETKIRNELSALKAALIQELAPPVEGEEEREPVSVVHAMHEELGMAGSRNAFPIKKDKAPAERLGQRPGMFIGLPNRHHRKHLQPQQNTKLGKGAFKIDENRPVNN